MHETVDTTDVAGIRSAGAIPMRAATYGALRRPLRARDARRSRSTRSSDAYVASRRDPAFRDTFSQLLRRYVGRPTPLYEARRAVGERRLSRVPQARGPRAYRRAQDQQRARAGACSPSAWARRRIVAETGAGQHGVATATVCALLGLACAIYMGSDDMARQALNVVRMRLLGADVRARGRRQPHAEGRHQRGHARLGGERRRHPLPAGVGARAASVPADGSRVPVGHRSRSATAGAGRRRPAARRGRRLRRRRQQRHRDLRRLPGRSRRAPDRRRGGRRAHCARPARGAVRGRQPGCAAGHAGRMCCRTRTATSS